MTFAEKNISKKIQLVFSFFGALLLASCGSYYSTGDGIYGGSDQGRVPQERVESPRQQAEGEESASEYERYFATQSSQIADAQRYMKNQSGEQEEIFTDPDEYYSDEEYDYDEGITSSYSGSQLEYGNANTPYTESNPGWGMNPTTVNVNYYGYGGGYYNPYIYRPYYYNSFYPFYTSYYPYYPYYGYYRPYFNIGFGFGYAGFYGGYYSPFYRPYYRGYYSPYYYGYYRNPYYAYNMPYRYGRSRNYRSSSTARSNIRSATNRSRNAATNARSTTARTSRNTATSARRSATTGRATSATARRSAGTVSRTGATRSATRATRSRRITNPKGINAGGRRSSATNSVYQRSTRSGVPTARSRASTTTRRSSAVRRSTPSRATRSTPVRRSSPAVRSSSSRSSSMGSGTRSSTSRSSGRSSGSRRR